MYSKKDMAMLEKYANNFLEENFGIELTVPIIINGRLTRALGRFVNSYNRLTRERLAVKIELSKQLIEYHSLNEVLDVLKHELVHYALFTLKKPYSDTDSYFVSTCNRLNISLTDTMEHKGKVHVYKCGCREHLESRRIAKNKTYVCKLCKEVLVYDREDIKL